MKALFVELPAFARRRADYLDDAAFSALQAVLMTNPDPDQRKALKAMIKAELKTRNSP